MSERTHDTIAVILIAAVCIAYLRGAQGIQSPLVTDPLGPSAFPTILGWSGLILAVAQVVFAWWGRQAPDEAATSLRRYLKPFLLFGLLVGYALLLELLGYLLATFTFVAVSLVMLGEPAWRGGLVAVGFSAGFYYVFVKILKISLPFGTVFRGW
jgi:putative tricarboxylic transport membrane protein